MHQLLERLADARVEEDRCHRELANICNACNGLQSVSTRAEYVHKYARALRGLAFDLSASMIPSACLCGNAGSSLWLAGCWRFW